MSPVTNPTKGDARTRRLVPIASHPQQEAAVTDTAAIVAATGFSGKPPVHTAAAGAVRPSVSPATTAAPTAAAASAGSVRGATTSGVAKAVTGATNAARRQSTAAAGPPRG